MSGPKDGGPAFSGEYYSPDAFVALRATEGVITAKEQASGKSAGMSLRDHFATHADVPWNAVIETLSIRGEHNPTVDRLTEYRAQLKYMEADAMLSARLAP